MESKVVVTPHLENIVNTYNELLTIEQGTDKARFYISITFYTGLR